MFRPCVDYYICRIYIYTLHTHKNIYCVYAHAHAYTVYIFNFNFTYTSLQRKIILNRIRCFLYIFWCWKNDAASQISPARQVFKIIKVKYVKNKVFRDIWYFFIWKINVILKFWLEIMIVLIISYKMHILKFRYLISYC